MSKATVVLLFSLLFIGQGISGSYVDAVVDTYQREEGNLFYLGNKHIEIGFRKDNGALWSVLHRKSGVDLRKEKIDSWQVMWGVTMLTGNLEHVYTDSGRSGSFQYHLEVTPNGTEGILVWRNLRFKDGRDCPVEVSVKVSLYQDSPFTVWRAIVRNLGSMAIEKLSLPLIAGIQGLGTNTSDDCLIVPDREGRLFHAPSSNLSKWSQAYPSCFLNMQFMAYYDKSCGFYFATYDSEANLKEFSWSKEREAWAALMMTHHSEIRFGADFILPYDVILGVFSGDWFSAAEIYKEWAAKQWWATQKLTSRDSPCWVGDTGVCSLLTSRAPWQKQNKTLHDIVVLAKNHRDRFGVPVLIHLWGWESRGVWTDYFPPYEGWDEFDKMVEELHQAGCRVTTSVSAIGVNSAWKIWKSQEALDYAVGSETGSFIKPGWDPYFDLVLMCIGTPYWQSHLEEVVLTMVRHGVDMIHFDGFPPVPNRFACYDAQHGHPLGAGGNWFATTWIRTMSAIVLKARKINPNVTFTAEGTSEIYIPYLDAPKKWRDEYAEYDSNDQSLQIGTSEIIPLFNYVYHEYTFLMSTYHLGLWSPLGHDQYNSLVIARTLIWGEMPLVNTPEDLMSKQADRDSIDLTAKLARARCSYARDFLVYGQMQPSRVESPTIAVLFHPDPSVYRIRFDMKAPAVLGSSWRAVDGSLGIILTNIAARKITCEVDTSANAQLFGDRNCTVYRVVDNLLDIVSIGSAVPQSFSVPIDPRQVVLIVLTKSESARAKAIESIQRALDAIAKAKKEERVFGISDSEALLNDAIQSFIDGNCTESRETAKKAEISANTASRTATGYSKEAWFVRENLAWLVMVVLILTASLSATHLIRRRNKTKRDLSCYALLGVRPLIDSIGRPKVSLQP